MSAKLPFGDDPITLAQDDLLGRELLAEVLAAEIATLDARQGAVVAITGPWGSGKTSLMNLAATQLRDNPDVLGIVDFNPWLFSGAEQLAESLLTELAAQLRDQESGKDKALRVATDVTSKLLTYSRGLSVLRAVPTVGTFMEAADKSLEVVNAALKGDQSLQRRRNDAVEALAGLDRRVIVLVDDIDRLTREETRDLFRTVRLSASFPNVVYVLCLDHTVVASALDQEGFSGKAYLEKILTVTCRVPELADHQIGRMFIDGLNAILARHDHGPDEDEETWAQAYHGVIRPLFSTVRDAKRVLASLPITLRLIGDELPVPDVVVLECLRTLYPDLHAAIGTYAAALTEPAAQGQQWREPDETRLTAQIAEFVATDKRFGGRLARQLVQILFPHARHRIPVNQGGPTYGRPPVAGGVGWSSGLIFYLTHELPAGVAPSGIVRAITGALGNETAFRQAFDLVPGDRLENALGQVLVEAQHIRAEDVAASVRVLLELFPRLREGSLGVRDSGAQYAVSRPILQMLRHLEAEQIGDLAEELVLETPTIYGAFELLRLVGHKPNAGHQLVDEEKSAHLQALLRGRIVAAGDTLAGERELTTLLFHTCELLEGQPVIPELMSPSVAATVLKTGTGATTSQLVGAMTSQQSIRLYWDILVKIYGGENNFEAAMRGLRDSKEFDDDSDLQRALDLAERYLTGWRPLDPFEDFRSKD